MPANIIRVGASSYLTGVTEVVIDTNVFVELIDPNAKNAVESEQFINDCLANKVDMYITETTHQELLHVTQVVYTNEIAKMYQLNTRDRRFKGGNGFKRLQKELGAIYPNYYQDVSTKRDAAITQILNITDVLSPISENHLANTEKLQNKLNGCIETNDVSILLTALEWEINTIVTGDYGFSEVDGINVVGMSKGNYVNHTSSTLLLPFTDISKLT